MNQRVKMCPGREPGMHGLNYVRSVNFGWTGLVVDTLCHRQKGFITRSLSFLHRDQATDTAAQHPVKQGAQLAIRTVASGLLSQLMGSSGTMMSVHHRYSHSSILR